MRRRAEEEEEREEGWKRTGRRADMPGARREEEEG